MISSNRIEVEIGDFRRGWGAELVSLVRAGKGMNKRSQGKNLFSLLYQLLRLMDHPDFLLQDTYSQLKYIRNHHKNTRTIFEHTRTILLFLFQPNRGDKME